MSVIGITQQQVLDVYKDALLILCRWLGKSGRSYCRIN